MQGFCKEFVTWKALCHRNVLPLIGVIMTKDKFAMVSEWMSNGNINQFVKVNWNTNRFELVSFPSKFLQSSPLVDDGVIRQLRDVAKGLIYMHEQGMVHGDLKGVRFSEPGSFCL